jgi:hypothetical protein
MTHTPAAANSGRAAARRLVAAGRSVSQQYDRRNPPAQIAMSRRRRIARALDFPLSKRAARSSNVKQ